MDKVRLSLKEISTFSLMSRRCSFREVLKIHLVHPTSLNLSRGPRVSDCPIRCLPGSFPLQQGFFLTLLPPVSCSLLCPSTRDVPTGSHSLSPSVRLRVGQGRMRRKRILNEPICLFTYPLSNSGVGSHYQLCHIFLTTDSYAAKEALTRGGGLPRPIQR